MKNVTMPSFQKQAVNLKNSRELSIFCNIFTSESDMVFPLVEETLKARNVHVIASTLPLTGRLAW